MASRIKGITIEIGGDTTGLDKALKSVNLEYSQESGHIFVNSFLKIGVLCFSQYNFSTSFGGRSPRELCGFLEL